MHSKARARTPAPARKTFRWGISSTTIDFLKNDETRAAADGCGGNDCSAISPLPVPRSKPQKRPEGQH